MKTRNILLLFFTIIFVSCGVDRRPEYAERTAQDRWIEAEMRENYYWYQDMPAKKTLNFFEEPEAFFKKLLSSKDGKSGSPYSRIEAKNSEPATRSTTTNSYGFQYAISPNPLNSKEYFASVLYTLENSPATDPEAGLLRGDLILSIGDEEPITNDNIDQLTTGPGIKLNIGRLDEEKNRVITETKTLGPSRYVEDNPIYFANTYERAGKKIGYMVYNSFVSGKDEENTSDITYLQQLSSLSNEFKAAGVEEFILDLRYNPGGELNRPVPFFCSMLISSKNMGNLMGYTEFNDKNTDKNEEYYFSTDHLLGGSNLDLSRVFILTSEFTASASEAVISFLDARTDIIIIGDKTVGKNVGSQKKENDEFDWVLHPIVCKLYNTKNPPDDYSSGIAPKYTIREFDYTMLLPLGHPNEPLLYTALSVIDGTYNPEPTSRSTSQTLNVIGSSLDRKSLPGVIINP